MIIYTHECGIPVLMVVYYNIMYLQYKSQLDLYVGNILSYHIGRTLRSPITDHDPFLVGVMQNKHVFTYTYRWARTRTCNIYRYMLDRKLYRAHRIAGRADYCAKKKRPPRSP